MAGKKKMWVYTPPKPEKPQVPASIKVGLQQKADEIIENILKPNHITPPPADSRLNYIVDIYSKWHRNYFYFCAKYNSPGENSFSQPFETKFARMEYMGNEKFNVSYMRHTGQWWEIYQGLSMQDSLKIITEESHFIP